MTRGNKTWYVEERGILLAGEFLLELGAISAAAPPVGIGFDYLAFFKSNDIVTIIAVEVKTTERQIKIRYTVPYSVLHRLQRLNIPALIIVVDVKQNDIYFTWVKDAAASLSTTSGHTISINLRKSTAEEREKLRQEILAID
jgi:hypothetical protein